MMQVRIAHNAKLRQRIRSLSTTICRLDPRKTLPHILIVKEMVEEVVFKIECSAYDQKNLIAEQKTI